MNHDFAAAMRRAARLTHASDLAKATQVIQHALAGRPRGGRLRRCTLGDKPQSPPHRPMLRLVGPDAEIVETPGEPNPSDELPGATGAFGGIGAFKRRNAYESRLAKSCRPCAKAG